MTRRKVVDPPSNVCKRAYAIWSKPKVFSCSNLVSALLDEQRAERRRLVRMIKWLQRHFREVKRTDIGLGYLQALDDLLAKLKEGR